MDTSTAFLERARHYLATEYPTKIRLAVQALPPAAVWWRPNAGSNSIGNLLLHLAGNVRQWVVSGVGGDRDDRDRASEFARRDGLTADELLATLNASVAAADAVLAGLTAGDLGARRTIQGRDVTVFEAVFHVVEHFSMHTGQIILLAKVHAPAAISFYEDAGGLAKPVWR